jgi:hypothetical protein
MRPTTFWAKLPDEQKHAATRRQPTGGSDCRTHFNFMKKLIIAANLGRIRVLKYREAGLDPIDQEHLLNLYRS